MLQLNGRIKTSNNISSGKMPVIGYLKIGEKRQNAQGKEYPASTDYFVPRGKYADLFLKQFGNKCSQLTIAFISDNVSEVCNQRYEWWQGGVRYGYGDGQDFYIYDTARKAYIPFTGTESERERLGNWEMMLTLRFLIVDITGIIGVWQLDTKAKASSIPQIVESFDFVMRNAGRVKGIPFDLQVEKVKSYKPSDQGKPQSVYPVLKLIPNISQASIEKLQQFANSEELNKAMLLTEAKIKQIEASVTEHYLIDNLPAQKVEEPFDEDELIQLDKFKNYVVGNYDIGTSLKADKEYLVSQLSKSKIKDERLLNQVRQWIDEKADELKSSNINKHAGTLNF